MFGGEEKVDLKELVDALHIVRFIWIKHERNTSIRACALHLINCKRQAHVTNVESPFH